MATKITVYDKAKQIAEGGCKDEDMFKFFDKTNRDILDYIALFAEFGIPQNKVWDIYETWQQS